MRVGDLNQYPSTSPITTHPGVKNINAQKKKPQKNIVTYLSSLPNMSKSVAFSLERSAIFSARSRSLWKLLWMFLINSLLAENWFWMSVGRYS